MIIDRGNQRSWRKIYPSTSLTTTDTTYALLVSNSGLCSVVTPWWKCTNKRVMSLAFDSRLGRVFIKYFKFRFAVCYAEMRTDGSPHLKRCLSTNTTYRTATFVRGQTIHDIRYIVIQMLQVLVTSPTR